MNKGSRLHGLLEKETEVILYVMTVANHTVY